MIYEPKYVDYQFVKDNAVLSPCCRASVVERIAEWVDRPVTAVRVDKATQGNYGHLDYLDTVHVRHDKSPIENKGFICLRCEEVIAFSERDVALAIVRGNEAWEKKYRETYKQGPPA